MPEEKDRAKEFLDKFTGEMILSLKKEQDARERERKEKERIRREIEIHKLKEKFSKETVEKIKPRAPPIVFPPAQPAPARPVPAKPVAPRIAPRPEVPPTRPIKPAQPSPKPAPAKPRAPPAIKVEVPKNLPPVAPGEIDFGKIIFLVRDPLITYIECPGPSKRVIIRKAGNTSATQITLTKEEIIAIIKSFSEKTRIPLVEGMLTARYENMEISAVVSETMPPSFIIKKDIIPQLQRPPTQLLAPTQPYIIPVQARQTAIPAQRMPIPLAAPPNPTPASALLKPMPKVQAQPKPGDESFFKKKIKIG
jgi:hypothetical protein